METSIQEVADHVYQFKVPIPFKLRDINLYLVKDSDGCLLIDTGTNTPATVETLQASLAQLGVTFADLRYVVITHFHSDHAGLAGLIQQHSPAQILMHADGAHFLSAWSDEEGQGPVYMAPDAFFLQHGLPDASLQAFRTMRQRFRNSCRALRRIARAINRRRHLIRRPLTLSRTGACVREGYPLAVVTISQRRTHARVR